jgi:hypothetical protein
MVAWRDLDHLIWLPADEADCTLRWIELTLLITKYFRIVLPRLKPRDSVRRCALGRECRSIGDLVMLKYLSQSVHKKLIMPICQDQTKDTQQATIDGIELQSAVELRAVLFAARRLHQVKPEEQRSHYEYVQRSIAKHKVHHICLAESVSS